jgi:hypothetical protein
VTTGGDVALCPAFALSTVALPRPSSRRRPTATVPTSRCASFCRRDRGVTGGDRVGSARDRGGPGGFTRPAAPAHYRAPVVDATVRRGARRTPTSPETVPQRWSEWRKKDCRRGKVQIHCSGSAGCSDEAEQR